MENVLYFNMIYVVFVENIIKHMATRQKAYFEYF